MKQNSFFLSVFICALIVLGLPGVGYAQRCDVDYEVILKLRDAEIGAFSIWSGIHGDVNREEGYAAGAINDVGHVVVVGTRGSMGQPFPELILSEIDRRGRVIWETKRSVQKLSDVLGMKQVGNDYIVSAKLDEGREKSSIWVGFFNEKGFFKSERIFRQGQGGSLSYASILPDAEGKGFSMVASAKGKSSTASRFAEFYRLNSKGQVMSKRAYNPGPENALYGIFPASDGHVYAVGSIDNARGNKTGWLLKLDEKGNIVWQRQYPRGSSAELIKALEMPDGSVIVIGTALPATEDAMKAGWVMKVNPSNGEVVWQRYLTGDLDYSAKDMLISKDGLISVMLTAKPLVAEEGEPLIDYMRLVTLNPRGVIFDSATYFQGEKAQARQMILGPSRERIMIGRTQIAHQMDEEMKVSEGDDAMPKTKRSFEGWIVAAPAMQSYDDPCKPKQMRALQDR